MLRQARNSKAAAEATQRHANAQRLVEEAKALGSSDAAARSRSSGRPGTSTRTSKAPPS